MTQSKDYFGQKFGRLTAIRYDKTVRKYEQKWIFLCDCGREKSILVQSVRRGLTRSCGCLSTEAKRTRPNHLIHGDARVGRVTRLHSIWRGMLRRCSKRSGTASYAGRGITVCAEWRDYRSFKKWAEHSGYSDALSIDRIDNNGPYAPKNCRWIPMAQQARNRRTSVIISGKTLAEWANDAVVQYDTLRHRILVRKWPVHLAISTPAMTPSQSAKRTLVP